MYKRITKPNRCSVGASQLEFAAIFAVLVLCVLLPLINLVAIPIRFAFAGAAIKDTVHYLALSDKFSQAQATLQNGEKLQPRINAISGVTLESSNLYLLANNSSGGSEKFSGPLPQTWLPDGDAAPYHYNLVLSCQLSISPLFLLDSSGAQIPGLTVPFQAQIQESCAWENLSKNPETQQFYLNE